MPSRNCKAGDIVFVRATVIEAASDAFQVLFDDGGQFSETRWVPARECAKLEDLGLMKPIRRRAAFLER